MIKDYYFVKVYSETLGSDCLITFSVLYIIESYIYATAK